MDGDVDTVVTNANRGIGSNDDIPSELPLNNDNNNNDNNSEAKNEEKVDDDPNIPKVQIVMDIPRIQWFIIKNDQRLVWY